MTIPYSNQTQLPPNGLPSAPSSLLAFELTTLMDNITGKTVTMLQIDAVIAIASSPNRFSYLGGASVSPVPFPTFYVDGVSGLDSNDGKTPATAWQTIAKVNAQTWLFPGTQVLFAGGQTFAGTITPSNGLTAANPLVFGSYGTGQATINAGNGGGFLAQNMGGIIVQALIFTGTSTLTNTAHGIRFDNSQAGNTTLFGISVLGCTVSGFGINGIYVSGSTGTSGFSGVVIDGCIVHDCTGNYTGNLGSAGIYIGSSPGYGLLSVGRASHSNILVQNCIAYNNLGKAGATNWVGSGIFGSETDNHTIQFCQAYNNGTNGNFVNGGAIGIWLSDNTNGLIQFCESHHNHTSSTADGGGLGLDGGCQNCTIQYCYSHDNEGSGLQIYSYDDATVLQDINKVIRFCVSQNDCLKATTLGAGLNMGSDSTRAQTGDCYNNTIFCDGSVSRACLSLGGSHVNIQTGRIANNIFYSTNNAPLIALFEVDGNPSGMTLVGNDYYNTGTFSIRWNSVTYTTFAAWQTATGQEKVAGTDVHLAVNPQLASPGTGGTTNGYVPNLMRGYIANPGAPVFGAGQNLKTLYGIVVGATDFFGNRALLNGNSIGAGSGSYLWM